jgi:hypothetical protein
VRAFQSDVSVLKGFPCGIQASDWNARTLEAMRTQSLPDNNFGHHQQQQGETP